MECRCNFFLSFRRLTNWTFGFFVIVKIVYQKEKIIPGGDESGWCSDVASTHGAWRHAGVRFLLRRGEFSSILQTCLCVGQAHWMFLAVPHCVTNYPPRKCSHGMLGASWLEVLTCHVEFVWPWYLFLSWSPRCFAYMWICSGHRTMKIRNQFLMHTNKILFIASGYGLVAMTFASHAKGREFDPHYPYVNMHPVLLCHDLWTRWWT